VVKPTPSAFPLAIALSLATLAGCAIRTTRARDATLHYHPTLDELKRDAPAAPPAAPVAARVHIGAFAAGYPQPIGLAYSNAGAFRKVVGIEWSKGEVEAALRDQLRARFQSDEQSPSRLGGGLVSLAVYRFGGSVYASALLEVRLVRHGDEVYAARYRSAARGNERAALLSTVAAELADQVSGDRALLAALGGAP
jgi:hypothetical protein